MLDYDLDKMLFRIPADKHSASEITAILEEHPEVQFVSLVGIDIGGHDTDEKIPVKAFLEDIDKVLSCGVQTDGSSVALPKIAELNNAKVDIIPDLSVHWYVDYNFRNLGYKTGLPVGTLRIPSFLVHNDSFEVGSRVILRDALRHFKKELIAQLREHPYVFRHINGIDTAEDIEDLIITSATELEFWVKTPDDKGDREQLFTAQVLKEQYWKRTYGEVRTALEETLVILDKYGFEVEMGHKEVGGVKARMGNTGHYDHVMEQLEIDWKYADAMQAADNENQVKYVVRDIFTKYGLDVTFMAKPFEGVAGSGEHTHLGLAAKLKSGKVVSLFAPADFTEDFMNPLGYGALMGILKNYEVINPFVSSSNDSFNRLKPGYEAPVCIVTSLGKSVTEPSRNRTVLAGLIRDPKNPMSTRFELRAPNPKSNTYLVIATSYLAILDGIKAVLAAEKTPGELEKSLSKRHGEKDFYLETEREYRSENDVFEDFTEDERTHLFGKAPATVWENLTAFGKYPEKLRIFKEGGVMPDIVLESYHEQTLSQWKTELHDRIIPQTMEFIRSCKRAHSQDDFSDYDIKNWLEIDKIRHEIAKDTITDKCLLTRAKAALDEGQYGLASDLQLEIQRKVNQLSNLYIRYKKNLL
ncbi:glutamine synthetase [Ihubacter sp. rT4E-8]|uniref:glutamine synthetase n=1 Tax=unclassified Ihubacter TaxID=2633299 RepID=UPI003C7DABE6